MPVYHKCQATQGGVWCMVDKPSTNMAFVEERLNMARVDGNWDSLCWPGLNGIQSVIVVLFYWGTIVKTKPTKHGRWLTAVQDCLLAISHLSTIVWVCIEVSGRLFSYLSSILLWFSMYTMSCCCIIPKFKNILFLIIWHGETTKTRFLNSATSKFGTFDAINFHSPAISMHPWPIFIT